jgi:tRNA pseudouridine55 synthase
VTRHHGAHSTVDGVVLLNKPRGISSQQAVSRVRHLFHAAKAGHTGTLDPAADGLLPVCLGEATKFSHVMLDADKTYLARVRLGVVTDTGDAEGTVIARDEPVTDRARIARALTKFRGELRQVPPMHSALKHQGVPLYEYARKGKTIERAARTIHIYRLELVELEGECATLRVTCSKGTYIRVLAADIGTELGCGASLDSLTRERSGSLALNHEQAVTLAVLEAAAPDARMQWLLPLDTLLGGLPALEIAAPEAARLLMGQKLGLKHAQLTGLARVYGPNQSFLGLAQVERGGRVVAQRMLAQAHVMLEDSTHEPV